MLTSLLRASALMALMASIGADPVTPPADDAGGQAARGTASPFSSKTPTVFDIGVVAAAPGSLVGTEVMAYDVCVREVTSDGFWVGPDHDGVPAFVRPAEGRLIDVRVGESVSVYGEVRLTTPVDDRAIPYVYAFTVRPAWPVRASMGTLARGQTCPSFRHRSSESQ